MDLPVLDDQQAGDALTREEIVDGVVLLLEAISEFPLVRRLWQRRWRGRLVHPEVGENVVEMAERADTDMLVVEPVLDRPDRIAFGLAQDVLVRRGNNRRCKRNQDEDGKCEAPGKHRSARIKGGWTSTRPQ
jgi:hypothetical protein